MAFSLKHTTIGLVLTTACLGLFAEIQQSAKAHAQEVYVKSENKTSDHVSRRETRVTQRYKSNHTKDQMVLKKAPSPLVGYWHGEMPMVSHTHPISFEVTQKRQGLEATFTYMGMDTRAMENKPSTDIHFAADGKNIRFLLADAGIQFQGTLITAGEIEGTLDWLGRKQLMRFKQKDILAEVKTDDHHMMTTDTMNVAILVFDGVDVLDWAGPMEVFANAHVFNAYTVAPLNKAYEGMGHRIIPEYSFANMPDADILIIPGGSVASILHQQETIDWIKETSAKSAITMSVCNGVLILGGSSMLDGLQTTTHGAWMEWLTAMAAEQGFEAIRGPRFVDNGKILTTAGVSSGIDGALHLVARLKGLKVAKMAARNMEYDWQPEDTGQYKETIED